MLKFKTTIVLVIIAVAIIASVLIHHRAQASLVANETLLQQQNDQLAALTAENQRLSNQLSRAKSSDPLTIDHTAELADLRAKVESLRQRTNQLAELAQQAAESRRLAGAQFYSTGDSNLLDHSHELNITFAGGPRADGKLNDARSLAAALRKYADKHQGQFPDSQDQITPYLPKPLTSNSTPWANAPLSGTNDFEFVFQGTQTDLTNIPPRRVALIRERTPWQTADGKWARVYAYADGAASTVESDDNFQSWDAQHVIPSQAPSQ